MYSVEYFTNVHQQNSHRRRFLIWIWLRHRNTSSVGEMTVDLDGQTLEKRRKNARLVILYKILEGKVSTSWPELKPAISRSRRASVAHSNSLSVVFVKKKDLRLNSFLPRTIRDLNNIPSHVVHAQ